MRRDPLDLVVSRLASIGLAPAGIDYLVCTHFDWDRAGNHDLFPNAEVVVQREHFAAAKSLPRLRLFDAPWDTPSLRYRLVDGDTALLPGIELIASSGHVPGHQSVLVRLRDTGPVLLAIDAISGQQLDPAAPDSWADMDHEAARANVWKLQGIAAREDDALALAGFPSTGVILRMSEDQWPGGHDRWRLILMPTLCPRGPRGQPRVPGGQRLTDGKGASAAPCPPANHARRRVTSIHP